MSSGNQFKKLYNFDESFFNEIDSEDKAYILGFISADGSISRNQLRIRLQIKDIDILYKIKEKMKSSHPIIEYNAKIKEKCYKSCGFLITSTQMTNDLEKYGVIKDKSESIDLPNIKEEYKLYWIKGYFDGNGGIDLHSEKYPRIRMCSSNPNLLNNIINYFSETLNTRKTNICKIKDAKCYELYYISQDVLKIYEAFYKNNNNVYLDRKYKKFIEIFN